MLNGQPELDNPLLRLLFQVILDCVKLTIKTNQFTQTMMLLNWPFVFHPWTLIYKNPFEFVLVWVATWKWALRLHGNSVSFLKGTPDFSKVAVAL